MQDFYENLDLKYPEEAILVEDISCSYIDSPMCTFQIPILTPYNATGNSNETIIRSKLNNLMNADSDIVSISDCTLSNSITIKVPNYIIRGFIGDDIWSDFTDGSHDHDIPGCSYGNGHNVTSSGSHNHGPDRYHDHTREVSIPKGTKFIVVFLGGNISQPKIIGVC